MNHGGTKRTKPDRKNSSSRSSCLRGWTSVFSVPVWPTRPVASGASGVGVGFHPIGRNCFRSYSLGFDKIMSPCEETAGDKGAHVSAKSAPQRILVVDDELSLRQVYCKLLIRSGYSVDTAKDGAEGWKMLQAASFDLLITDNNMPKVTGVELVRMLRAAHMFLPVILASGALPENLVGLQLAGTLSKPFSRDELLQSVREALLGQLAGSATIKMKKFARQLLACEGTTGTRLGPGGSAVFGVCEDLRGPLGKVMGVAGFHSLMDRGLVLASVEVPWLKAVQINANGSLEGLAELEAQRDLRAVTEGEVVLAAHLLGLLVSFIGPFLTVRLLRDLWPTMDDLTF